MFCIGFVCLVLFGMFFNYADKKDIERYEINRYNYQLRQYNREVEEYNRQLKEQEELE
jgi:uncharacterized membrane protein